MLDPVSFSWEPNKGKLYTGLKSAAIDFSRIFFRQSLESLLPHAAYLADPRLEELKKRWSKLQEL